MPLPLLGLLGAAKGAGAAAKLGGLAGKAGKAGGLAGKSGELLSKGSELLQGISGGKEGEGEQVAENSSGKKGSSKSNKKADRAFAKALNGDRLDEKDVSRLRDSGLLEKALAIKSGKNLGNGPTGNITAKA